MEKRANGKNIQARHNERQRKRIREQKLRRCIFFTVVALIVVLCITFLTPVFHIKNVKIQGNNRLTTEEITEQMGEIKGKNLFAFGQAGIKRRILSLAYAEKVGIKKKIFPPTVIIEIIEREPAFQIVFDGKFVLIDKTGKVVGEEKGKQDNLAVLEGAVVVSANKGSDIVFKNSSQQKTIIMCIEAMNKAGIIGDITSLSFEDLSNIKFNYQGRLDVICGGNNDFQRKLALLKEAVNSNKLTENSRGTINLSTTGKAIYTP